MLNVVNIVLGVYKASEAGSKWGSRMEERISNVYGWECKNVGAFIGGSIFVGAYLYSELRE